MRFKSVNCYVQKYLIANAAIHHKTKQCVPRADYIKDANDKMNCLPDVLWKR